MKPIKILQFTNKPAYPQIDGGCLGMAKMSDFYDTDLNYSIDIITIETAKHPYDKIEFEKKLSESTNVKSVFINSKPTVLGVISNFFGKKSYNLSRFYTKEVEEVIVNLLDKNQYDIIQFENIFVGQYYQIIRKNSNAKLVLNSANVEFEIWERLAKKASFLKKIYLKKLAKQLKAEEIIIWNNMDGIIAATDKDKTQIIQNTNNKIPSITIPFYLNLNNYKSSYDKLSNEISFFHIGAMDWLPNIEGVKWLINNLWNTNFNNTIHSLNLAGKSMPDSIIQLKSNSINIEGFVEDAKQFISDNDVMLVPLFSGSGIRVKIVEAMALGKCIISTKVGAEGINYEDGINILLANNEIEFVQKMSFLIENPSKINEIGKNARLLVEKEHNVSLMENKLKHLFDSIK